ncbi:MAG TPA: hypothetical protein VMT51_06340 [Dongiaceae bacterium]|nr:hypothetical protein [Dongiaceae bacterium]
MFSIKKYTPLFPAAHVASAVLFYFKFFGLTTARFSGRPILQAFVFAGYLLPLFLMRYYPTFAIKHRSQVQTEEFFFTGQGYFEAAAIGALGWVLNEVPCPSILKYCVFLCALPAIHFLFTKRIYSVTPEMLHYSDVSRPLNPDE